MAKSFKVHRVLNTAQCYWLILYYIGPVIELCERYGVKIVNGSVYHPQTQGKVCLYICKNCL